jgi:hypothetical protein
MGTLEGMVGGEDDGMTIWLVAAAEVGMVGTAEGEEDGMVVYMVAGAEVGVVGTVETRGEVVGSAVSEEAFVCVTVDGVKSAGSDV